MSNKDQQKMDGIFDTSTDKGAARPDKPARPAKPKSSLTRETKVGLAVIAALLVIFVVVLVVRLRGGSEEPVATGPASSKGTGTDKPKTDQQKTTPPESRTLIAAPTDSSGQWPGTSSTRAGGFGAGSFGNSNSKGTARTSASGSAYSGLANANDDEPARGSPPAGYLPPDMHQGSRIGAGELQTGGAVDRSQNSAMRLNQPDAPRQAGTAVNPFEVQPGMSVESVNSSRTDEAVASDEADMDDAPAAQASAATGNPFSGRTTGQIELGLERTPKADVDVHRGDLQPQGTTPEPDLTNAIDRKNINETELGEASRFVPNGLGVTNGVNRFAANESEAKTDRDDIETIDADRTTNAGKLTPVKGVDSTGRKQNLANADRDLPPDTNTPFRKPFQSAAAPALLDDAVFEGNGQTPAPIQSREATNGESTYIVAAGDTYWTIAKEKYDSGAYFKALYEHNRRQSPSANTLRPGMQLVLPNEATLQRLYPTLCPRPQRVAAAPGVTPTSATLASHGQQHVVSEGDTLYDVARRRLGNTKRWAEIYELNRDAIGAPGDRLEPGTRLVLPQRE